MKWASERPQRPATVMPPDIVFTVTSTSWPCGRLMRWRPEMLLARTFGLHVGGGVTGALPDMGSTRTGPPPPAPPSTVPLRARTPPWPPPSPTRMDPEPTAIDTAPAEPIRTFPLLVFTRHSPAHDV